MSTEEKEKKKISIAMVCLGNICRSPMAEAIFKHKVRELGYNDKIQLVDSFGTSGWHAGDPPDSRSIRTCKKHGITIQHFAQQITPSDFNKFDYVLGMDETNVSDLKYMKPRESKCKVALLGDWKTQDKYSSIIQDPYYGGIDGFERSFQQISHFSEIFLKTELD